MYFQLMSTAQNYYLSKITVLLLFAYWEEISGEVDGKWTRLIQHFSSTFAVPQSALQRLFIDTLCHTNGGCCNARHWPPQQELLGLSVLPRDTRTD